MLRIPLVVDVALGLSSHHKLMDKLTGSLIHAESALSLLAITIMYKMTKTLRRWSILEMGIRLLSQ